MKKAMLIAVAALMAFGATACSKKEAEKPGNPYGITDEDGNELSTDDYDFEDITGEIVEGHGAVEAQMAMPKKGEDVAVITTNFGTITMKLFPDTAPKAVENFVTLAKDGYYDGQIFHRVINDFMIQGGDPTGTGTGGESIWGKAFEDEYSTERHPFRGAVCMANAGPNTNGSQFFIVQAKTANEDALDSIEDAIEESYYVEINGENVNFQDIFTQDVFDAYRKNGGTPHLDHVFGYTHTVFGQVIEGMDVVDAIAVVETNAGDKPLEDVVVETIQIVPYEG